MASSAAAERISRGLFMGGALAVGASAFLAGCGSGDSSDSTAASASSAPSGAVESNLEMFSFVGYNSPNVIKSRETQTGAKFNLSSYNSNEQLLAKLEAAQGTGG